MERTFFALRFWLCKSCVACNVFLFFGPRNAWILYIHGKIARRQLE